MIKKFNVEKTKQLNKINKVLSLFFHKPKCSNACELDYVKNILIVDFALMGDMVMNIPFLKSIKHNCPQAQITMVGMPWSEMILEDQGLVDEFIIFDGKNKLSSPKRIVKNLREIMKVLKIVNQKKYEIGLEPKGDLRHILFLHYTDCDRTISYNYTGGEYLITDSFTPKPETKHIIDEKLDLLEMSGMTIYDEDRIPKLKLSIEAEKSVNTFIYQNHIKNKRRIGIHPGASNINKQYRFYPELIESLVVDLKKDDIFCVFEGPEEEEIVNKVCTQLKKKDIQFLRVKRNVKEYINLVSICDYMICNDSAAGHIAAAYGIPSVIFFGPVMAETALPRGNCKIEFISHNLKCKPCTMPTCPLGTEECIQSITITEGLYKVKRCFGW